MAAQSGHFDTYATTAVSIGMMVHVINPASMISGTLLPSLGFSIGIKKGLTYSDFYHICQPIWVI
jgi:hypothetical protein